MLCDLLQPCVTVRIKPLKTTIKILVIITIFFMKKRNLVLLSALIFADYQIYESDLVRSRNKVDCCTILII